MSILFLEMQDQQPSRTAAYMAFFRALETMEPPSRCLFTDPYAFPLLSGALRTFAWMARFPVMSSLIIKIPDFGWPYTRSSGVVRTRAIDDMVDDAIRGGACQFVLLGAGFDSRAYRLRHAQKIAVFEVDHPATQQAKRKRLTVPGELLTNVHFVPVDFEKDDLEARLIDSGFDPAMPTVVLWEGVISYLTKPSVERNFALLSRLLAPTSRLIFTYMDKAALDGSKAFPGARRWRSCVKFSGEPFVFGFDPGTVGETLLAFGFLLEGDVSTEEVARQYCAPKGRKEPGSPAYRVAVAVRAEG